MTRTFENYFHPPPPTQSRSPGKLRHPLLAVDHVCVFTLRESRTLDSCISRTVATLRAPTLGTCWKCVLGAHLMTMSQTFWRWALKSVPRQPSWGMLKTCQCVRPRYKWPSNNLDIELKLPKHFSILYLWAKNLKYNVFAWIASNSFSTH